MYIHTWKVRFLDLHVKSILLPLPTSRADLEPPKGWVRVVRVRVRIRFRVRSGVGLVWAPQPSFCAGPAHYYRKPLRINRY